MIRETRLIVSAIAISATLSGIAAQDQYGNQSAGALTITRLQYSGGGDWYADPSSLPNLIKFTRENAGINIAPNEGRATIGDDQFWGSSYFYITGHGNIFFDAEEATILRSHLLNGAFLHADDNYGMDSAFRREMKKVFPEKSWVELGPSHEIYSSLFTISEGLPKIHEHDNQRPQCLGLFEEDRLIVLYTYESDLGDGWEDEQVHDVPSGLRQSALQMGANIIAFVLSQ